ncbi:arginase [Zhengella mangrovi]|uniref:Arginase n=1 Tax=Zhengella mangrovi TaxID=1982044 RepID=A0A2G1QML7_9HYPH|nr:arginase family protein [Zhengella mangrovi]PHP66787.1 arginase [Zhengella mangrovi]
MQRKTLRLNMPQWQGGNEPAYFFGSELLSFLAPRATGPEETVPVDNPADGAILENENGIVGRSAVVRQAKAARALIDKHAPDRIAALGGDCLIDLVPIAYLNERYGGDLGVLWIDCHPDVIGPRHFAHSHAHVLGALLGVGDPDLDAQVPLKLDPRKVIYAGLQEWSEPEGEIIARLGLRNVPASELAQSSRPILDWIEAQGIKHLAIHFDLDVLDPARFTPLLFNNPAVPAGTWNGIPQGRMALEQVMRLLQDVAGACDVVGLAIAEHLPWDMLRLRDAMREMPILGD